MDFTPKGYEELVSVASVSNTFTEYVVNKGEELTEENRDELIQEYISLKGALSNAERVNNAINSEAINAASNRKSRS